MDNTNLFDVKVRRNDLPTLSNCWTLSPAYSTNLNTDTLQGKVVLVTGGAKGIGRMISEGFVQNGATVYVSSRDAKACEQACKELNALGKGKADFIAADLYKEEDITRIASELKKRAGSTRVQPSPSQPLTTPRARCPRQQQRQQLGRVLRHLPIRRLGPRLDFKPQARLPAHPSRNTSA
jgi:NAD(P)-dependent dehydrogenase (short-subunit alcohol dehydrogenase family)